MLVTTRVVRSIFHRGLQLSYGRSPARRRLVYRPAARGRELKIGWPRLASRGEVSSARYLGREVEGKARGHLRRHF